MIDLHMHTTYSDGSDTLIELLKKCEEEKLEYISITDHDTCESYNELENIDIKDYYSGKLIPGIELATYYNGVIIEILGYDVDYKTINDYINKINLKQRYEEKNKYMLERVISNLEGKGIIIDKDKLNKNYSADVATYYYLIENVKNIENIIDYDGMKNVNSFYRNCITNPKSFLYVDISKFYLSLEEVVDLIHKAGGKAFLAHAYLYSFDNIINFINDLRKVVNLDGIEVYHSSFKDEESNKLIDYCKKNNLYMSGGSDFHGKIKPFIKLRTGSNNLSINKDILTWYN